MAGLPLPAQMFRMGAGVAAADACISCHNTHADSPRDDFKLGETLGGMVIRIPIL